MVPLRRREGGGKLYGGVCMLAYCTIDGLTVSGNLLRTGELFVLPPHLEKEVEGKSDDQVYRWQMKTWKKQIFRFPTGDELLVGYRAKKVLPAQCTKKERMMLAKAIMAEKDRKAQEAKDILEGVDREDLLKVAKGSDEAEAESGETTL